MVVASGGGNDREATNHFYLQVIARDADAKKVRKKYSELVHGHQALRRDYQKLIAVMKELTAGLESVTRACTGINMNPWTEDIHDMMHSSQRV